VCDSVVRQAMLSRNKVGSRWCGAMVWQRRNANTLSTSFARNTTQHKQLDQSAPSMAADLIGCSARDRYA
jgi:hypothetical protein